MRQSKPLSANRFFFALIVCVLFLFTLIVRFSMLQKSTEPNGLDGYFYALQAKSLVETGRLENPSTQIGYYISGACAFFAKDAITGVKFWSAISSALISLGVFLLLLSLTGKNLLSLLGFLLVSVSPSVATLAINYINNQTGVCFLLLYAASLSALLKNPDSRKKRIFMTATAVLFFALSALSHKVTMMYALILSAVVLLPIAFRALKKVLNGRRALSIVALCLALIFAFFAALVLFRFFRLHAPRFIHAFDYPSLPILHKYLLNAVGLGTFEMTVYPILLYALSFIMLIKKIPCRNLMLLLPVIYFPFWNLDRDMGLRLLLNAVPLGIPLLLYFFHVNGGASVRSVFRKVILTLLNVLLLCAVPITRRIYDPEFDPPYQYYKSVVRSVDLDDDSLLIAHLGLNHVYTYEKGLKDALNWLPNFPVPKEKLWRLSYGASEKRIQKVLSENGLLTEESENLIQKIDDSYTLIREDLWQAYLLHEEERIAEALQNWNNPHEVRPDYIRKPAKQGKEN